MSLFCDDGVPAEITPWVPIPLDAKGKRIWPLESERDRCQRAVCGKVAWQHWTVRQQRGRHAGRQHLRCTVLGAMHRVAVEVGAALPHVHHIRWYKRGRR